MADIELIRSEWLQWVARQLVAVSTAGPREDHAMTMTQEQVGQRPGLRNYIVIHDEHTRTGTVQMTLTVQADSVEMNSEYVRLSRAGVGVVFAVRRELFVSLVLDDGQPDPPTFNKGAAAKEWWDTPAGQAQKEKFKEQFSKPSDIGA